MSVPILGFLSQIERSTTLISSADSVSSKRGNASGRPTALVRARLMAREGVIVGWSMARDGAAEGEGDGEKDIRSLSGSSSSAFRFRTLMLLIELCGPMAVSKDDDPQVP